MFGKDISEYVSFQKPLLILILTVGLLRLVLSMAGLPIEIVKWFSITTVSAVGGIYYAVLVNSRSFGTYRHLLPLVFIQNVVGQAIMIAAVILGIITGKDNIFTAPEYSVDIMTGQPGVDGKTWMHAGAHAVFGVLVGTLIAWGVASVVLLIARKASPRPAATA